MAERLIAHAWKACSHLNDGSEVRILLFPLLSLERILRYNDTQYVFE